MDVHDSTAQEQRYTNPRQEKAVAEVSRAQLLRVLKDFFIVQSVNEHGSEGVEAWKGDRNYQKIIFPNVFLNLRAAEISVYVFWGC